MQLYDKRIQLSQNDIEYADYVWQLYCSDNPIRLENLTDFGNYQYDYLSDAIKTHLRRFPTIKNGLNDIENHVLQLSVDHKPKSKRELLRTVLQNQGVYGFGDSQFERIIGILETIIYLLQSSSPYRKKGSRS